MKKLRTYKFRLYPTKSQEKFLLNNIDLCRNLYNCILEYKQQMYRKTKKSPSKFDINKEITKIKKDFNEYQDVYSQVLQDVSNRIDKAFKNFFRNLKRGIVGYPKFKKKNRYRSFVYTQSGFKLKDKYLTLSKIGDIKIKIHRELDGKIKQVTIKKTNKDKWFACISIEKEISKKQCGNSIVGIDLGIERFITFDNGNHIENPRFFKSFENKLRKYESKRDKSKKGSSKRRKYSKIINRIYEKVHNQKHDYFHKLVNKLLNNCKIIHIEDLSIQDMLENNSKKKSKKSKKLNQSINEMSWRTFINILKYKSEEFDCKIVEVDPAFTSQMCSSCGKLVYKKLNIRQHNCQNCGLDIHRDHNAAINIKTLGT